MITLARAIRDWIERRPDNWDEDQWYKDVLAAPAGDESFTDRELGAKFMDRLADEIQDEGPDWGPGVQVLLTMTQDKDTEDVTTIGRSVRKHVFIHRQKDTVTNHRA